MSKVIELEAKIIAPVLRDKYDNYFNNFEKAYRAYFNCYTEEEQKMGFVLARLKYIMRLQNITMFLLWKTYKIA